MNAPKSRGSFSVPINNRVVPYNPALAEELSIKKPENSRVSGRLLALVYQQLNFWSKYAKHKHNGKRYFWKSQQELANELAVSTKQINRALKALLELGLLIREKLHKRFWKQTYFYFLPKSPHTAELEASIPVPAVAPAPTGGTRIHSSGATTNRGITGNHRSSPAVAPAPVGSGARTGGVGFAVGGADKSSGARSSGGVGANVPFTNKRELQLKKHTLKTVVERCFQIGGVYENEQGELVPIT
jgi:biotin operon repressor